MPPASCGSTTDAAWNGRPRVGLRRVACGHRPRPSPPMRVWNGSHSRLCVNDVFSVSTYIPRVPVAHLVSHWYRASRTGRVLRPGWGDSLLITPPSSAHAKSLPAISASIPLAPPLPAPARALPTPARGIFPSCALLACHRAYSRSAVVDFSCSGPARTLVAPH